MSMLGNAGPSVLQEGATEEKGEHARLASFVGAMAISDLVKSTLGPKGMDKILMSVSKGNQVTVTNDGATILKSIYVDNAAAKVLVDISKAQDDEVGDGTTSVVVFAGELLRQAEQLVNQKVHPMTIIQGFREACTVAKEALEAAALDHAADEAAFRKDLMNIARTTLSSKILTHDKDHFANLACDAVMRLKGSGNLEMIQLIQKPGGSLKDSFLDEGFILDKKFNTGHPKKIENAKILIANTPMDTDKIKIYGARVRVDSMAKVGEIEAAEKAKMAVKCEKIAKHGCNLFINRQLIYNYPEQVLSDLGVASIEHADFDGVERLALVTGGEICSTFDDPEGNVLGTCDTVEEIMIGEDRLIKFSGVAKGVGVHNRAPRRVVARARRGGTVPPRRALRARIHREGQPGGLRRRVPRDDHVQGGRGARGEDPGQALARHGGFRQGAEDDPDDHLRERGSGLERDCEPAARQSRPWRPQDGRGHPHRGDGRHGAVRDHRVLQGQAAGVALGYRGGGDDHPRRRHHQVRAQAARAVKHAGERARFVCQRKDFKSRWRTAGGTSRRRARMRVTRLDAEFVEPTAAIDVNVHRAR